MDPTRQDRDALEANRCPDCGEPIRKYMGNTQYPLCENCDTYFSIEPNGWVVRNPDADRIYQEFWNEVIKETKAEVGI